MYQSKLKKGLIYLTLGFLILFSLRLLYGYRTYPSNQIISDNLTENRARRADFEPKNHASAKLIKQGHQMTLDQKYEKVGTLTTTSNHFEEDEQILRSSITIYQTLIQFEQRTGLNGHRILSLAIGVSPVQFQVRRTLMRPDDVPTRVHGNQKNDKTIKSPDSRIYPLWLGLKGGKIFGSFRKYLHRSKLRGN